MTDAPAKILIIDDASLVRLYYRNAFEAAGFAVAEALNGIEAMELLLTDGADLMVVDINMPQMDGITFLHRLRAQQAKLASIPAIVISTESGASDREAARQAGANFYIAKPATPNLLVETARLLCGRPT
ncbi:MAG TPA: response regulator [Micropepsaceae bacterium]|nr:response regulator [Micropepsaceae bacterium]